MLESISKTKIAQTSLSAISLALLSLTLIQGCSSGSGSSSTASPTLQNTLMTIPAGSTATPAIGLPVYTDASSVYIPTANATWNKVLLSNSQIGESFLSSVQAASTNSAAILMNGALVYSENNFVVDNGEPTYVIWNNKAYVAMVSNPPTLTHQFADFTDNGDGSVIGNTHNDIISFSLTDTTMPTTVGESALVTTIPSDAGNISTLVSAATGSGWGSFYTVGTSTGHIIIYNKKTKQQVDITTSAKAQGYSLSSYLQLGTAEIGNTLYGVVADESSGKNIWRFNISNSLSLSSLAFTKVTNVPAQTDEGFRNEVAIGSNSTIYLINSTESITMSPPSYKAWSNEYFVPQNSYTVSPNYLTIESVVVSGAKNLYPMGINGGLITALQNPLTTAESIFAVQVN